MAASAALLALPATPAAAEFRYAEPVADATVAALDHADPVSLVEVLRRLAGPDVVVRLDRRIDPARRVLAPPGDWRSLLWAEGLDWRRHGDELHVRPAGLPAADVELVSLRGGSAVWRVAAGEWLHEALGRWTARAGGALEVRTDRRWRLEEARVFEGAFAEALAGLEASLAHLGRAPAMTLIPDGRRVVVTHRPLPAPQPDAPPEGESE